MRNNNNLGILTQNYHRNQLNINNELLYKKGKTIEKIKAKKFFLNSNISVINNNSLSTNKTNVYDSNNDEYKNKNRYIKNPFDSFKIRKEISSYIYSSPKNQIRFINYIMMNKSDNKINDENDMNNKTKLPANIKKKSKIKLIKDVREKDEDKINFKESPLFSLFFANKNNNNKNEIKKNMKNKNIKSIESWDNNLLKNILPQNIKNYNEYDFQNIKNNNNCELYPNKKKNSVGYYRNCKYQTFNSVNNNRNKTKYDFKGKFKKINMILINKGKHDNENKIKTNNKIARSSSFC